MRSHDWDRVLVITTLTLTAMGCAGDSVDPTPPHEHPTPEAFRLTFAATHGDTAVDCDAPMTGLGPSGTTSVGLSDLRFYISNLRFLDVDGAEVEATLDEDAFQYTGATGWVGLVDLTSNQSGDCQATAISFSEGTERTHDAITGTTLVDEVVTVAFDVGVPQALMQEVIGANTVEAAPSPLNEMYWSWAAGYRHFVFNATVDDGTDVGEGYVHIGSRDCAAKGELALESRDECGLLHTPQVEFSDFRLTEDTITVDLGVLVDGLDLTVPVLDPKTFEVIGQNPGIACHTTPAEEDCETILQGLGIDPATGTATASNNQVFGKD